MVDIKKILHTLPNKKAAYFMIGGVFIKALLNFMGLAAILALLVSFISKDKYGEYLWIIASGGILFLIVKNSVILVIERALNKYLFSLYRHYSADLLHTYYNRGLLFVREKGSHKLTHEINFICFAFVSGVLTPLLRLISEILLLILMVIALSIYSPIIVLLVAALSIPLLTIYFFIVRKKMSRLGKMGDEAKRKQWSIVDDIFKGYSEIRINRAYDIFRERFNIELLNISRSGVSAETYKRAPQSLLEIGMAAILFTLILFSNSTEELQVFLSVFAVGALRILPSITALISSWLTIKNYDYTIEAINEIDTKETTRSVVKFKLNNAIKVDNISFKYPDAQENVIDDLSFTVEVGKFVGIRGASGSGKSTLLGIMQGLIISNKGGVYADETEINESNCEEWHKLIAYLPQEVFIVKGTLIENIALGDKNPDINRVIDIMEQVQLGYWYSQLKDSVNTIISANTLSGGERQRIGIARSLYKRASVVFLDEPTSSLDSKTEREIVKLLDKLNKDNNLTLIMISHRETTLEVCDKIIEL